MRQTSEAAKGTVPLVTVLRGTETDTVHFGAACIVDSSGSIRYSLGDPEYRAFFRSSSKPLQAIPLLVDGIADAYGFDARDLAVICGSHTGSSVATDQVAQVLKKSGVPVTALGCGDGLPDQCSGKHAGMLAGCKFHGLSLEDYLSPDHPWQRRILATLSDYCGLPPEKIHTAEDGCSAVTFGLPIFHMALAFARLARETGLSSPEDSGRPGNGPVPRMLRSISEGWGDLTGEPDLRWVAVTGDPGKNRPSLVTKGGAGGLLCAALPGLGLGIALKIADGSPIPRWQAFRDILRQADLIDAPTYAAMLRLNPKVLTRNGKEVGGFRTEF